MKKLLQLSLLFVATFSFGQTPIYQFNFNGNLNNSGTSTVTTGFVPSGTVFYAPDRFGTANRAFNSSTELAGAILPDLPLGNSARTLNLWLKFSSNIAGFTHYLAGWGTRGAGLESAFAIRQSNTTATFDTGPTAANFTNTINTTAWYMYTYTYDGTILKHYINGVLKSSVTRNFSTVADGSGNRLSICRDVNDSTARIGAFSLDELNVYNVALTDTQITALFANQSLPTISNVSSSLIHEGANISYTLNAGGASTTTTVLYGQTAAASELAATGTTATGTTNTACTATTQYNLSAAAAGTTMYYKIQATNSVGTVFSPVYTYTQVAKPTYNLSSMSNITTTSAQVNYTLNPNGANATSVVRYGTSIGSYPNTVTGFSALGFAPNFNGVTLSGLTPNTVYYFIVEGTNTYGVSQSAFGTFTTQGGSPTLSAISVSNIAQTTATVNFSLNSGGTSTTTVVNYGTSSNNLNNTVNGSTVNTNVATPYTINLTGLTANTTYYYNVVANGNGTAFSGVDSFTTLAVPTIPNPVYNFEFNNNLQSQDGSVTLNDPIFGTTAFSYVSNGTVSNGAIQINDARSQTQLPNLPQGAANRSVHVRLRFASGALFTENFIFNWGTGATGQAFAYHQTVTTAKLLGWGGAGYDYASIPSSNANFGVWYEYVFTYNGTTMSVYRDGTLLGTSNATLNTNGDVFRIGVSNSGIQKLQADIDYIRVFNQALTGAQVSQIYSNPNLLSNTNFSANNLKFNLYPNPTNDILNIEMENEIQSLEIYSLLGQKVMTANNKNINIGSLSNGLYMVRVQDIDGGVATQKLVKK